jgi:hypothetical protein
MSLKNSLIKQYNKLASTKMNRASVIAYMLTGVTFSGTIVYSIVQDQEKLRRNVELTAAKKEIERLNKELADVKEEKSTIGLIGSVGVGLALIGPAVMNAVRLS